MNRAGYRFLPVILILGIVSAAYPLDDSAAAERYALWAKNAIDQGMWEEALASLERASDFADVSSDLSYLLALARSHENKPRRTVLEALETALRVDRWSLVDSRVGRESARLLKAENLIALRAFREALIELSETGKSVREAELRLNALLQLRSDEFRAFLTETFDRYPRETRPVRIFFTYLKSEDTAGRNPGREDLQLLDLVTRRLPALILNDAELAWMAAPFMRDTAEAKRLVLAYRAVNKPVPASLPAALRLGVIDEETAIEELFTKSAAFPECRIDIALLDEVWELLRREEARELFRRNLSAFSGVFTEDANEDGIPEIFTEYSGGTLKQYSYDADQDGVPELTVYFEGGDPGRALVFIPPETSRKTVTIRWEQYPAVLDAELDGVRYVFRPRDLFYTPLEFVNIWNSGLLFPERDPYNPPIMRRVLVTYALRVERPSLEFPGGIEVVELNQGIPVRAREYVGDILAAETEFLRGRPQLQRVDLNLDGRIDTVRHFSRDYRDVEIEELWDYDRDFDYTIDIADGELYE